MPGTDTRHITSSEDANQPPPTRQISQDGTEIIPTRILKVSTPKPASNPLQFIKTGPCDLYKAAQEQIKKVEEIKKVEKVKDDSEDWQSNLDNWKCSRRKRQEHIIERVVEVKKLEMAEHDRNRRRSKTFNEMMEERNSKSGLRKMSILSYSEDDSNDLSDLGISNKEKSSGDFTSGQVQNESNNYQSNGNGLKSSNGHGSSHHDEESSSTPVTISSPEPEEYTFERAIQGYMNFAETKVKMPVKTTLEKKEVNGSVNFKIGSMKKEPSGKIGEKLSELEQIRLRSKSTNDINGGNEIKQLPKVDVNKRRSLFEKVETKDVSNLVKSNDRFPNSKSIKEKFFNSEKTNDNRTEENHVSVEVSPLIKETICCLEKQNSVESTPGKRLSNGDVSSQISVIKERLNSLKQSDDEEQTKNRSFAEDICTISIKERLSNFDVSSNQNVSIEFNSEAESGFKEKLETFKSPEKNCNDNVNNITESNQNICSDNKPNTVRLDRLIVEDFKDENEKLEAKFETSQSPEDVSDKKLVVKLEEELCIKQEPEDHLSEMVVKNNKMEKEEEEEDEQENSVMYTDENIDEVLGKDEELETSVDDEPPFKAVTEEAKMKKELEIFAPKEIPEMIPENLEKPLQIVGNYENVFITNQVPQVAMSPDSELYSSLTFPLGSRPSIEPPKEKPPPPPLELSDDEINKPELPPKPSLRRVDSTKRIKKEIRKKRSDFLGIEGSNEDNYLEPEYYVAPPPDMMTFLQEERRFEKQLYRQSICSESDSNHETAESRDSGVELDRGHVDDICWSKPDVLSEPHSRQNSETFGNTSITSEEDEILKKEREIIEVLEKEEQWRYGNKNSHSAEQSEIGEKLAVKLRQLEQEKMQLERERAEEEDRRKAEESARRQNEQRLIAKQQQLLEQEEALRFERERLQKEQEHLERCRQNLLKQQQNSEPLEIRHHDSTPHWDTPSNRHSLQEVPIGVPMIDVPRHSMQDVSQDQYQSPINSGYRYSLPDLQQREQRSSRPPPPVPPAKPIQRPMTQAQWERETNIRNSRIPSADNIPLQIEASNKLRHGSSVPAINIYPGRQQMTRSTLHALSAAPRSRLISNEHWMQPKRKIDAPKTSYNYQHWLIQEAEHRRILEHQQKMSHQLQPKRMLPYNGQTPANYGGSVPSHHTVGLPISFQVQNQSNNKWISPPRSNKPLPDAVIQTLTQRVQNRENKTPPRKRVEVPEGQLLNKVSPTESHPPINPSTGQSQERMLSVSGKKKCSHCNEELGRGAAMIIESLRLFYHIDCFKCCVCHVQLGDGLMGTDVRVRNNKLHCHNCYSSDDGVKFSCV